MARTPALLGVHLASATGDLIRAGTLTRDATGATTFVIDEVYLRSADRPTLSLRWVGLEGEAATQTRLANRGDKIAHPGFLPPWFSGLLPEGALRELVETEMGPGDHDQFDVLARLGADLPGAVVVLPETDMGADVGAVRWDRVDGRRAPVPEGIVKFSLAGVQLKFNAIAAGDRLTMPGRSGEGRIILKAPTRHYPQLPEAEFTAMRLCQAIGIRTAEVRLAPVSAIDGVPAEFMEAGDYALAVDRFDRPAGNGRIHMEDAAQIIGAVGERKYTMANSETVLNMIRRFSTDWREDVLEGMRRLAADVLIGNGDNHLKNWSFVFPDGVGARLSAAYDIVPTVFYEPRDRLALQLLGTRTFSAIGLAKFRRVGEYLGLGADRSEREVRLIVEQALEVWPAMLAEMPISGDRQRGLLERLETLRLVRQVRGIEAV